MKICSKQGKFKLMSINHSARSGGIIGMFFFDFLQPKGMLCVLIRIASNENTQYTIFNIEKKISLIYYPKIAAIGFFQGTQRRV